MQDFKPSDLESESVFLRTAIAREAERALERQSRHVLTTEDVEKFALALNAPPELTPRAEAAVELYRAHIVYAE